MLWRDFLKEIKIAVIGNAIEHLDKENVDFIMELIEDIIDSKLEMMLQWKWIIFVCGVIYPIYFSANHSALLILVIRSYIISKIVLDGISFRT